MTRAEDLLQALNALRNAASAGLSGEARETALQQVKGLFQLAGFDGEDSGEGANEASVPLAQAIADVRAQAEGELSGNAFNLASKSLDELGALVGAPQPVAAPGPAPVEAVPSEVAQPAGASFSALSEASAARVAEVAAALGVHAVHFHASPLHAAHEEALEVHETPAKEAAAIPAQWEAVPEPQSAREVAEATHDFGTPALATGQVPDYAAHHERASDEQDFAFEAEPEPEPEPAPSVTMTKAEPAASSPPASPDVATAKRVEAAPQEHQEKTFFALWLDMVFGRKK